jgi:hypothetical protein
MDILLVDIGGYFKLIIIGYWWLLVTIILVAIDGYFINGY